MRGAVSVFHEVTWFEYIMLRRDHSQKLGMSSPVFDPMGTSCEASAGVVSVDFRRCPLSLETANESWVKLQNNFVSSLFYLTCISWGKCSAFLQVYKRSVNAYQSPSCWVLQVV